MNKLTACMIVRNEDRFVWYSINSVLPFVSRFLIFDTRSSDKTVEIIKSMKSPKIFFEQKNRVSPRLLTSYRQEQVRMVNKGWLWIVDADEVYPKKTAEKVLSLLNTPHLDGIIAHRYDLLGDIYHYQSESVGSYNQFGKSGHYVLRLINKNHFPDLQLIGDYPDEYFAENGRSIKARGKKRFAFVEERIFHCMYLQRSTQRRDSKTVINRNKFKIELGYPVNPKDLPEVFFAPRPGIVPNVLEKRSLFYIILALVITPFKKLKRLFF